MKFPQAKVYNDGSHYIAIPQTTQPWKKKKIQKKPNLMKEKVENVLKKSKGKTKTEMVKIAVEEVNNEIKDKEISKQIVKENIERLNRNAIERRKRLSRKAYLQKWDYFCTFTYDSSKLTESQFRVKFLNCIKHQASRNGWKYIGVWEKSPTNERLHFHGLFYIPIMVEKLEEIKDYSTKNHKMQITNQNTFFFKRFGRNDFKKLPPVKAILQQTINYLMKYIQKTGEKIIYSKGVPTYFKTDILEEDIVCTIGQEDRKLLLFDNFMCLDQGEIIGQVSQEVIDKMPKAN